MWHAIGGTSRGLRTAIHQPFSEMQRAASDADRSEPTVTIRL
jgi:hypothetical protein